MRLFLETADAEENALFTQSLHETLAPLDQRPRYIIPRDIVRVEKTWVGEKLSGVLGGGLPSWLMTRLPKPVSQLIEKRTRERAMWHAVPAALAKNKDLVEVFQKHWNRHVSPGEAVFGQRGEGAAILEKARRKGLSPSGAVHEKDIFL